MKTYLITYDLRKTGQNYDGLIRAIELYPNRHPMQSTWFIKTDASAEAVFNHLKAFVDPNDSIFISEVTANKQGWIPKEIWAFIESPLAALLRK